MDSNTLQLLSFLTSTREIPLESIGGYMKKFHKKIGLVSILLIVLLLVAACSPEDAAALTEAKNKALELESQISSQADALSNIELENESLNTLVNSLKEEVASLQENSGTPALAQPSSNLLQSATDVVAALQSQDMTALADLTDPSGGVTFSPYIYVNPGSLNFQASALSALPNDTTVYTWGTYDGSGDSMDLTFSDYYAAFVYDHDYLSPEIVSFNQLIGTGNMISNLSTAFPNTSYVEFHFSGFDPQYSGMDWSSLILVFNQQNGLWYLTGIIHNGWTI
jgi:hypothetical protein